MLYGYARVSTLEQNLEVQEAALRAAGCDLIRAEKKSGSTTEGRKELEILMQFLREGDVLVVTRIDRLARSLLDLQTLVTRIRAVGASLRCTEQPIDMTTPAGSAFLGMLGVFAEFELNLRRERQAEGIERAKATGVYRGRPKTLDTARIKDLRARGAGASAIAQAVGCSRSAVYKTLREV